MLVIAMLTLVAVAVLVVGFRWKWMKPKPLKLSEAQHRRFDLDNGYSVCVYARVKNEGAKGRVVMRAWLYLGDKTFSQDLIVPFEAGEAKYMCAMFTEPGLPDVLTRTEHRIEIDAE